MSKYWGDRVKNDRCLSLVKTVLFITWVHHQLITARNLKLLLMPLQIRDYVCVCVW